MINELYNRLREQEYKPEDAYPPDLPNVGRVITFEVSGEHLRKWKRGDFIAYSKAVPFLGFTVKIIGKFHGVFELYVIGTGESIRVPVDYLRGL